MRKVAINQRSRITIPALYLDVLQDEAGQPDLSYIYIKLIKYKDRSALLLTVENPNEVK